MQNQKGFTLIELMIVVAIIGILAAIAIPAYQFNTVRAKISEAITQASLAKSMVSEAFISGGISSVTAAANEYNTRPVNEKKTKYVDNITIDNFGVITVTLSNNLNSGFPTEVLNKTMKFTPNVRGAKLANDSGSVDWACATTTSSTATSRGLVAELGTLVAKYAPPECR